MKSTFIAAIAAAALGFAAAAHAGVTPLTIVDDDGNAMPGSGGGIVTPQDRAREAAAEGPQALRSFVERTRMIYALNIRDYRTASDGLETSELAAQDDEARVQKELAEFREQLYRDMQHE